MKERPILFNGAMVRAILEGRKTQTRRVVKWRPFGVTASNVGDIEAHPKFKDEWFYWLNGCEMSATFVCPFGQPGDRLWVRETFAYSKVNGDLISHPKPGHKIFYGATDSWEGPRVPSIHMPRWASRITLEVTRVRIERLQCISEADAAAEGLPETEAFTPRGGFKAIWNAIHGDDAWKLNPWVWVIEFKKV